MDRLFALCGELGFSHYGKVNTAALSFRQEVRDMCASGRCGSFGKCWTCPPYCGTLEEFSLRASAYERGILVQTTAVLEDAFDGETMLAAGEAHKERFRAFVRRARELFPDCWPMGAGACGLCSSCTCPDAPCRFPEEAIPSMEACGLLVSDVCAASGLGYYYGPETVTYTACLLL